jgi:NitT/TauT family transport system ATP-binding protein
VLRLVDQLHDIITGVEMPDPPAEIPPELEHAAYEPLPDAAASGIVGLIEYLDARGGKDDLFRIAAETNQEFGVVITLVKAGEMLDFLDTPRRQVVLTAEGERFVKATPPERKAIWREQLQKLWLFHEVQILLAGAGELRRAQVLELIMRAMPQESYEKVFDTLVHWARFGDLFAYDEASELLTPQ